MVTDEKTAVTQVDIYTGPELYYTMVTSERQNLQIQALMSYK